MRYRYLLFDLDGTLTYSHKGIYNCLRYAFEKMGKDIPPETQLKKAIGPTLFDTFTRIFSMTEKEAEEGVRLYRERYSTLGLFENEPIKGSLELLTEVKTRGYKTALATAKPKVYADQIAVKFGFAPYFDLLAVATLSKHSTKSTVVADCIRLLGAKKEECLMIGDRADDVLGARENGVDCAAVLSGYAEAEEIENAAPKYQFNDLFELKKFLLEN